MINDFDKLRKELHEAIDKYGIQSIEVKKISDKFDKLVTVYYLSERQYKKGCAMYKKYIESINNIRKITREFGKYPSIDEWNKYAKEEKLLCTESLKFISGKNWHELRRRIFSEV